MLKEAVLQCLVSWVTASTFKQQLVLLTTEATDSDTGHQNNLLAHNQLIKTVFHYYSDYIRQIIQQPRDTGEHEINQNHVGKILCRSQ